MEFVAKENKGRPPSGWMKKMRKEVDADDPDALIAWIWHHKLSKSKRNELIQRYEGKRKSFYEISLVLTRIAESL